MVPVSSDSPGDLSRRPSIHRFIESVGSGYPLPASPAIPRSSWHFPISRHRSGWESLRTRRLTHRNGRFTLRNDRLTSRTDPFTLRNNRLTSRTDRLTPRNDPVALRTDRLTPRNAQFGPRSRYEASFS